MGGANETPATTKTQCSIAVSAFTAAAPIAPHRPAAKPATKRGGTPWRRRARVTLDFHWRMIFSENRRPLFRIMLDFHWRMIFSENRRPLFRIMLDFHWRMIFSENRRPLFRIMR
jgi:hypothetical protein